MTNYEVGDFLIRVKNAAMAGLKEVEFKKTNLVLAVAKTLLDEKYLNHLEVSKEGVILVKLALYSKKPILQDLKIVSRPGLRIYMNVDQLTARKGPEIFILSTSKGVMSSKQAIKKGVGGEVIAKVL